jgi:diaminopropionate ammonia-lyase
LNPDARGWQAGRVAIASRQFHDSLPGYVATPLIESAPAARELDVKHLFVKDESQRLGLPAFKILGASYAIARALSARLEASGPTLALDQLRERLLDAAGVCLLAATDGNHGRAVAHVARLVRVPATIYVPADVSTAAKEAIVAEGARLIELDAPYDEVVQRASADAAGDQGALLIQDTAWDGYEDIPQWIVDGYDTMLAEVDDQLAVAGQDRLDLVVVPAGVGSLAQAVVTHFRASGRYPAILVAEPDIAASVTTSLRAGRIVPVDTGETVMTGLNCGTVSAIAWPILRAGLDASITVSDDEALDAVASLGEFGIDSGPCGAATFAGARKVLADPERRSALGIDDTSVVVLLSTEGRAANPKTRS